MQVFAQVRRGSVTEQFATIANFRLPVRWVAITHTDLDIILHVGHSPAEPVLRVRAGGVGTVQFAQPVDALSIEWPATALATGVNAEVDLTLSTQPLQHWRHERDAVPFSTVQDTDFFSSFDQWRVVIGAPPAAAPVGLSWPLTWTFDDSDPTARASYPFGNSHAPNQPAELVPAAGVYALPSAASVGGLAERIGGSSAYGLDISEVERDTFSAVFSGSTGLVNTAFAAATVTQIATIYHLSSDFSAVRIVRFDILIEATTAATDLDITLSRLSGATVPSGGTAITPHNWDRNITVASTCQMLPTTAGVITGPVLGRTRYHLGVTAAAPVTVPAPVTPWEPVLPDVRGFRAQPPTLRRGSDEGFALQLRSTNAATIGWMARVIFTEE